MRILSLSLSVVLAVSCARGQSFINLNFESANVQINDPTYGFLDWNLAVPGWSGSTVVVYYGSPHAGFPPYHLLVSTISPTYNPGTQLAGRYSLAMRNGWYQIDPYNPFGTWAHAAISQTGSIPSSAKSIRLLAAAGPSGGTQSPSALRVFVGGVEIPMFSLGGKSYGGNIASFAGTTSELRIVNGNPENFFGELMVDNITFSPTAVPEPTSVSLLFWGSIYIIARIRGRGRN